MVLGSLDAFYIPSRDSGNLDTVSVKSQELYNAPTSHVRKIKQINYPLLLTTTFYTKTSMSSPSALLEQLASDAVSETDQQIEMWSPTMFNTIPDVDWSGTSAIASASTDINQAMVPMESFVQHVSRVHRLEDQLRELAKSVRELAKFVLILDPSGQQLILPGSSRRIEKAESP